MGSSDKLQFDNTLGAAFCGFALSALLFGILIIQSYDYYTRYRHDRMWYKVLVGIVVLLETFHQALVGHTVYYYAISNYLNPLALLRPVWSLIISVTTGALISVIIKGSFLFRVWQFSNRNIILCVIMGALVIVQLVLAVAYTVKSFQISSFAQLPQLKVLTTVTLAVSVVADLGIAISLTYYLHHLRKSYSTSSSMINGLIRYSMETGAVTSICGIATLVSFDLWPATFIFMSFFFVMSKLYSNSLLATLNTRRLVRGRGTDHGPNNPEDFTMIHTQFQMEPSSPFEAKVLRELTVQASDEELKYNFGRV